MPETGNPTVDFVIKAFVWNVGGFLGAYVAHRKVLSHLLEMFVKDNKRISEIEQVLISKGNNND